MVFSGPASSCLQCGKIAKKKCKNCLAAYYCGSKCQKKHWKSKHRQECKAGEIKDASALVRQYVKGLNEDKTKFSNDFPELQKNLFLDNRKTLRYIGRHQPKFVEIIKNRCLSEEWRPILQTMKIGSQLHGLSFRFLILTVFENTVLTISLIFESISQTYHCNYSTLENGIHSTVFDGINLTTQLTSDGKFTYLRGTNIIQPQVNPKYLFVNWDSGKNFFGLYDNLYPKALNGTLS
jgi:hypothetical protein